MFEHVRAGWHKTAKAAVTQADVQNYHSLLANGGFSHNHVTGEVHHDGYMVGQHDDQGGLGSIHDLNSITPQDLAEHREAATAKRGSGDFHQGGWVNNGKVHLDVSKHVGDKDEAVAEGHKHHQLAIWDIAGNREIDTRG